MAAQHSPKKGRASPEKQMADLHAVAEVSGPGVDPTVASAGIKKMPVTPKNGAAKAATLACENGQQQAAPSKSTAAAVVPTTGSGSVEATASRPKSAEQKPTKLPTLKKGKTAKREHERDTSPAETGIVKKICSNANSEETTVEMTDQTVEAMEQSTETGNEWQTVGGRKDRRQKTTRTDSEKPCTVFIRGRAGCNLVKEVAYKQAKAFKTAITAAVGETVTMTVSGISIRVVCKNEQQAKSLLCLKTVADKPVVVTPPYSIARKGGAAEGPEKGSEKWHKGVLKRVPLYVTESEIAADTGAIWVHRIQKMINGKVSQTKAVIIAFVDAVPKYVSIGLVEFQVQTYIPQPMRCAKCQKYGHKAIRCNQATATCPKCSQHHDAKDCQVVEQQALKCANCGQAHSAAYKGCTKYQQVSKTLVLAAKTNISYRDAAMALVKRTKATNKEEASKKQVSIGVQNTGNVTQPCTAIPAAQKKNKHAVEVSTQTDAVTETAVQTENGETPASTDAVVTSLEPLLAMMNQLVSIVKFLMSTIPATDRNAKSRHGATTAVQSIVDGMSQFSAGVHVHRPRSGSMPLMREGSAAGPTAIPKK